MKALFVFALAALSSAQSSDPYVQFLTGLLTAIEPSVGGQAASCIAGTTGGISSVRIGFGLIEDGLATGNVTEVFQGALQFNTALSDIKAAAATCGFPTVEADIAKIIDELQTNPLGVVAALFPYADTVVTDLQNGIVDFKSGNYTGAGQDIGSVLAILLTDSVSFKKAAVKKLGSENPYLDFLNGLLTTLEPAVGGKVAPCLSGADGSVADIRTGVALLQQAIQSLNYTAMFEAAADFKLALTDIQSAAAQCNVPAVEADINTLITKLTTDPIGVLTSLLPDGPQIVLYVATANSALQTGNYTLVGQSIGSIFVLILGSD